MKFYSIRERPDYIPPLLRSVRENWHECLNWTIRHIAATMRAKELPDTYVAIDESGTLIGAYTLLKRELLYSPVVGLWIGTLYIDPKARNQHLSHFLLEHARTMGGALDCDKIYLASDHTQYYEKFGFRVIGPDMCVWGEPTKMYEHDTIHTPPQPSIA